MSGGGWPRCSPRRPAPWRHGAIAVGRAWPGRCSGPRHSSGRRAGVAGAALFPLLLVVAGFFATLLSGSAFIYLTGGHSDGKVQLIDTGWVAGYLLIALGAVRAALSAGPAAQADDRPFGRWTLVLPYIPVTIAAILAVLKDVGSAPDPFLLWDLIIVIGLVIVRQFIVIWDNQT